MVRKKKVFTTMKLPPELALRLDGLKVSEYEPKYRVVERLIGKRRKKVW